MLTDCDKKIFIQGGGPNINGVPMIFSKQEITPNMGVLVYDWMTASITFVQHKVKYFEKFIINWQISKDGNFNWVTIGESVNPLYVTYKQPESMSLNSTIANGDNDLYWTSQKWGYKWFHTLLKVSCEAAKDEIDKDIIIDKIWAKIQTKSIVAADSKSPLFYYKQWNCNSTNTAKLLQTEDGQRGSWTHFLIDLLKIQNVTHSTVDDDYVHYSPHFQIKPGDMPGFLVKDWSLKPGILTGEFNPLFKYVVIPKSPFISGQSYPFLYSDVVDNVNTVSGQGPNGNPASRFNNHQVTQISGRLYDPSYGLEFSNLQDIEDNAIFGYYISRMQKMDEKYDLDGDGVADDDLDGNGIKGEINVKVPVYLITTDLNYSPFLSLTRNLSAKINQ